MAVKLRRVIIIAARFRSPCPEQATPQETRAVLTAWAPPEHDQQKLRNTSVGPVGARNPAHNRSRCRFAVGHGPSSVGPDADLSAHAREDHFGALGGSPRPALPAHSMSAAAEIRTPSSGSRRDGSSPRAISALTQGTVSPSQRAASGRVSTARPSIRLTGPLCPHRAERSSAYARASARAGGAVGTCTSPQAVCGQPPIWSRRWGSGRRGSAERGSDGCGDCVDRALGAGRWPSGS